jgi:predicted transcriptional regulator
LNEHAGGSILNDIDYGIPIRSHKLATDLLSSLVDAEWARRDSSKRYFITKEGLAALTLANSDEAKLVIPPEKRGRGL